MSPPRELRATYRLQLGPELGFAQARKLVPYLTDLGVSHLYLSPSLQARSGSTHGYDVVDPTRISEQLGGEEELRRLAGAGLGVILDIVPNHMGTGGENRWWSDERTRARWFDIDPAGGYRRFFDIDDMAAIRQEDPEIFDISHAKVLQLIGEGVIDGLRVDHPDGLADPAGYLRRLRERGAERVWVEKILHPGERLRDWPVSGTVGYEFLNDVCALYIDADALGPMGDLLVEVTQSAESFQQVARRAQLEQANGAFAPELSRLERLAPFGREQIAAALAELPVYRTYVEPWSGLVERADRDAAAAIGDRALAQALLLGDAVDVAPEFVTRFQQTSPAIAAKGVEDTAFYRYLRLLALNEVGGDPDRFGLSVGDFHRANLERAERFPEGLLVTQTHDTKRSGDSRARLGALTSMAGEWSEHVRHWISIGDGVRGAHAAPDRLEEYMLYQTLLGAWPIGRERLEAHLVKALREAKRNSSWAEPNEIWERAVIDFSRRMIGCERFMADFEPFAERVAREGERSALGQLLLKLTVPGVPDIYQGDELWRLSLVDPDNRRPVDWRERRERLAELRAGAAPTRATRKLAMIAAALELRRRRPRAFAGSYEPLAAAEGTCAFIRGGEVLVLAQVRGQPPGQLERPPGGRWRSVIGAGGEHRLDRGGPLPLADCGVALLERI